MNRGYIDMHCDSLEKALCAHREDLGSMPEISVDAKRLAEAGAYAQFFACFLHQGDTPEWYGLTEMPDHWDLFLMMRELFFRTVERTPGLAFCGSARDYEANRKNGFVSALLTVENGYLVQGEPERLRELRKLGVRLISLTWNDANCFGAPNSADPAVMAQGLTPFGLEAVPFMNELGLIVDVSHLSDGGFWDVCRVAKKPFVASHSNCRALSPHQRNLTDEMIRALAERGGIAGLNFCPAFLLPAGTGRESRVEDMCRHVLHLLRVGGEDVIALGTDFDGIGGSLEIASCTELPRLFDALLRAGLTERQLDKFMHGNAERVLRDCLG